MSAVGPGKGALRQRLYEIIFEHRTASGRLFDIALLIAIFVAILVIMAESIDGINDKHESTLETIEWTITVLFTIEYLLRLYCVDRPLRYATSFFGIIDLLSILPSWCVFLAPAQKNIADFAIIRALRLLRMFRILKLGHMIAGAEEIRRAIWASRHRIAVFLATVLVVVVLVGTAMYAIEDKESGFSSIPASCYWAIVTMTTVGYGDISPTTDAGKLVASLLMVFGYALIAVPSGIVSAEFVSQRQARSISCDECGATGHATQANHCHRCGALLDLPRPGGSRSDVADSSQDDEAPV